MKKVILIIALFLLFSCRNNYCYIEESLIFLNQIKKEFNDKSGLFLIHSYGAYLPPIITSQDLESELAMYLGKDVRKIIKEQKKLSENFENQMLIAENQIPIKEFHFFIEEMKSKNLPFWENLVEKYNCVSGISIPIFSEDYKYAFVYEYSMYGRVNGGGSCRLYRREGEKWLLEKTFNEWIS
ncbi:hypothetical protein [Marinifilum flexuosum]|uniref:hypothetical protein n=1 Tax=Marinifilum flexuosum TaxID=1117708 RepID=UPI0024901E61|nr:hypothetical protein [Marinifilum flexuosum]